MGADSVRVSKSVHRKLPNLASKEQIGFIRALGKRPISGNNKGKLDVPASGRVFFPNHL
jgi:hypothetical protein